MCYYVLLCVGGSVMSGVLLCVDRGVMIGVLLCVGCSVMNGVIVCWWQYNEWCCCVLVAV